MGWTRDGKTLVIRTLKEGDAGTVQLWRYPANGAGGPLKVDAGKVGALTNPMFLFHAPPFDPDHIAWTSAGQAWSSLEVWSADHALPKP